MATYTYDQTWELERQRLASMERMWDAGTFVLLDHLGVGPGSSVAEVGAGGGSVVAWMAERVGPHGRVLATDIDPRYLTHLAGGPVETLQHDILAGPLPSGEFDLVHARLLVEHLGPAALPNLCAGLRPGGVLLLEDFDMACKGAHPDDPAFLDGVDGVIGVMASSGFDPFIGRKLPAMLESAGLVDVEAEGRVRLVRSATPEADFSRLSMLALRQRLVAGGRLTEAQLDAALQWHDVPGRAAFSPVMVACWGRRPLTG